MYIPELNLKEYPEFIQDRLLVANYSSIEDLKRVNDEAERLNQMRSHVVQLVAENESDGYGCDWINMYFTYYRKLNKQDIKEIDSYNYRVIENYNKFIVDNPKIAEALEMRIQKHVN